MQVQVPLSQQIVSFTGAVLILVAYVGQQTRKLDPQKMAYNALNAMGGAVLAWAALHPLQWGFLILEGTWFVVSVITSIRVWRAHSASSLSQNQ